MSSAANSGVSTLISILRKDAISLIGPVIFEVLCIQGRSRYDSKASDR